MPGLRAFSLVTARLGDWSSFVYVIVVAIIVYDVAARYIFTAPTYWALELSIILAGSQFMLGGLQPAVHNTHVRIDGFYQLASPKLRRWMDVFTAIVAIFYLGFASFYCWKAAISAISIWETSASVWDSPSPTIIKTVIALSFTLVALQYAISLFCWLRNEPLPLANGESSP